MSTDNTLLNDAFQYIADSRDELKELLFDLCHISAPSNHEEKRAAFVLSWLHDIGAKEAYIDDALNVIFPMGLQNGNTVAFLAHTDTVFPDTEPFEVHVDGNIARCPGIIDDTVDLAMMLMVIKYVVTRKLKPTRGVLFVANSGEEGLGNLKGVRALIDNYHDITELYTFDGNYNALVNVCVGSHRYNVSVRAQGGHSFGNFGNTNAIVQLSELICGLYKMKQPKENCAFSYNVGIISGGTSINAIAQTASMLFEYRSDDVECLQKTQALFNGIIEKKRALGYDISVETLGIRPCMCDVDMIKLSEMTDRCKRISERHTGIKCNLTSGSTDANLPMSLGIPALCVGVYDGGGAHTREEWLDLRSLDAGMRIESELILGAFCKKPGQRSFINGRLPGF